MSSKITGEMRGIIRVTKSQLKKLDPLMRLPEIRIFFHHRYTLDDLREALKIAEQLKPKDD